MFFRTTLMAIMSILLASNVGWSQPIGVAIVQLKGMIEPNKSEIGVADIAEVTGGGVSLRRQIESLDVAVLRPQEESTVSKRQIETRILLSGIPAANFKVLGAERTIIRPWSGKSPEEAVLDFLLPTIAERLHVEASEVSLSLTRPIANAEALFEPGTTLKHFLPTNIRVGRWSTKLGVYKGNSLVKSIPVALEVQLSKWVFVASRRLERGSIITADDVVRERRVLSGVVASTAAEMTEGKELNRPVASGQVITNADIRKVVVKQEYVIRSRDIVEVVAQRRALHVRISGLIAMQRGRVGDSIRVKHPNTQKVLMAKVVDSGLVQIRL